MIIVTVSLLALYILALLGIAWFSLHPFRTPIFLSPGAMGMPQEDVEFQTEDGVRLKGWWTYRPDSKNVAVLAHGYMMNRSELTPLAVWLAGRGYSTLVFDSRAHGKSGGRKCGLGYLERQDILAAVNFARTRCPSGRLVLVGSSMGSAAIALAAAERPGLADALILDSCFSRLPQAISGWWRFLGGRVLSFFLTPSIVLAAPMAGFNPFKVDVARALAAAQLPVLFLHGDCDNLATPEEARRNEAALEGKGNIVWLAHCGHSEGRWEHPDLYYGSISRFLSDQAMLDCEDFGK
jgi:pimeloyl-ACP methyl ester carboxylesterase